MLEHLSLASFSSCSNKHSSLVRKSVKQGEKMFYNIGTRIPILLRRLRSMSFLATAGHFLRGVRDILSFFCCLRIASSQFREQTCLLPRHLLKNNSKTFFFLVLPNDIVVKLFFLRHFR